LLYLNPMNKHFIVIIFLCLLQSAFAQLNESFTDGDFSLGPTWQGDDSLFRVNASLQLQSSGTAGTSKDIYLGTPCTIAQGEWRFWVRFNLSPSTANFCRYYLMSDNLNLKGALNGYYIQLGGISGNNDSLMLMKQKGNIVTQIIGGRRATVAKANNVVGIRVLRNASGNWQLFSDTLGGNNYVAEGSGTDNEFTFSAYTGWFIKFTSSNITNFFLDDVYTGPVIADNTPPVIDSIGIINSNTLRIKFSEAIEVNSVTDVVNYTINNGIGNPISADTEPGNNQVAVLSFFSTFTNKSNYTISISGIRDQAGNTMQPTQRNFIYYVPAAEDVLISEWMADPSPPVISLPEQEFIELHNQAGIPINLKNWSVSDGAASAMLPEIVIPADSFIILCAAAQVSAFTPYGLVAGINGFPSLNNAGDAIILKSPAGNIIHQLNYDLSWYNDATKVDGGWSIELINRNRICSGRQNYTASIAANGATPGKKNSVWENTIDSTAPQIKKVICKSPNEIILVLNEGADFSSIGTSVIAINNGISIASKSSISIQNDSLLLLLNPLLQNKQTYIITMNGIRDCKQNSSINTQATFTYFQSDTAKTYDVLLTEIMADPDPRIGLPAAEYVELYNRSSRNISLKNWQLRDATGVVLLPDLLLLPDSFIVLCAPNNASLFSGMSNVVGLNNFPSLSNDGETISIRNADGKVIHAVSYSSLWYRNNLKKDGGWSLEMIDVKNPCGEAGNWQASQSNKGGTPGRNNSVRSNNRDLLAPELIRVYPADSSQLILYFSESLDSNTIYRIQHYQFNPALSFTALSAVAPHFKEVSINLSSALQKNIIYRLITDSIADCAGNLIQTKDYADFGLPEPFAPGELIINELLFNPKTGGSDFVELYNNSNKVIDLKQLRIADTDDRDSLNNIYSVAPSGFIVLPEQYIVLTENPDIIVLNYFGADRLKMIQTSLPSLNDDEGNCVIADAAGLRYDQFNYDDDLHFALLDDKNGVSLERIDYNRPSNDRTNWSSAAATSGYATPTKKNSQYLQSNAGSAVLSLSSEIFSPDGDGYQDLLNIYVKTPATGYTGTLSVYDNHGRMVKQLMRNDILGTENTISWDGITDRNEKAPIGIYIIYLEAFNLKGNTIKEKITVVVGAKL
jgi:hypothetical protein